MTPYYVYIVQCEDNSLYTGYTKNLNSRIKLHMKGKAARYTKTHKPTKLVYTEEFHSRSEAMKREKNIKKLTHRQKLQLTSHTRKRHQKKTKRIA